MVDSELSLCQHLHERRPCAPEPWETALLVTWAVALTEAVKTTYLLCLVLR